MTTTATRYVEDLLTQGYFLIPVPEELEGLYIRAHELWELLCQHYKLEGLRRFSFQLYVGKLAEGLIPEVDDGYLPRAGEIRPEDQVKYDFKHTWHHRPRLWPHMEARGAFSDPVMGTVWREFMLINQRIWEHHRDAVERFGEGLDAHPVTSEFSFGSDLAVHNWLMPLRHVLYIPQEKGDEVDSRRRVERGVVGQAHHDRNSFTFHGHQVVGAVQGFVNGEWIDMPTRRHHLRGFAGILAARRTGAVYANRRTTGGTIRALDHRGLADPTRPHAQRKATVSFGMHEAHRIQ